MMIMQKDIGKIIVGFFGLLFICVIFGAIMFVLINPKMNEGRNNFCNQITDSDLLMVDNRHFGLVNYDKFIALASSKKILNGRFDGERDVRPKGDSVFIKVNNQSLFYGKDSGNFWKDKYSNNPISISDSGFTAKLEVIDSVPYILIPYQVLISVASFVGDNKTSD